MVRAHGVVDRQYPERGPAEQDPVFDEAVTLLLAHVLGFVARLTNVGLRGCCGRIGSLLRRNGCRCSLIVIGPRCSVIPALAS